MIVLLTALCLAHPLSPASLVLVEGADGVEVVWRVPSQQPVGTSIEPVVPCEVVTPPHRALSADLEAVEERWTVRCPGGLEGTEVGVDGLEGTAAVVRAVTARGEMEAVVDRTRPRVVVAGSRGWPTVFVFMGAGAGHLMSGVDHVLFVFGLVLLVPPRRLIHAVTAFTVGHGSSLALAGLGVVSIPSRPVEVAIAASLMVLAVEVLRGGRSWVADRPWAVCVPFGLVHGLGFASALNAADPGGGVLWALLGFNLGIEMAQLALVGVALGVAWTWRPGTRGRAWLAYAGGGLAAMWLLERLFVV